MIDTDRNSRDHGLRAVVPEPSIPLLDLLARRYSCRSYQPQPVPKTLIEQMLAIAQLSASWCNLQPWEVIVTQGEGTERLSEKLYARAVGDMKNPDVLRPQPDFSFPMAYCGVYKERQREVGWQLYESIGISLGDRAASRTQALENFRFFGAPHALIITTPRDLGVYGAVDCGIYMSTLLLAAESLGLGIVPQAALASYSDLIREHLDIPDDRMVLFGASFGFAKHDAPINGFRSRRVPSETVTKWVRD